MHGLDGEAHRTRKTLFVDLHGELVTVYGGAVLSWVGLELPTTARHRLSRLHAEIVDGFGFGSPGAYARA